MKCIFTTRVWCVSPDREERAKENRRRRPPNNKFSARLLLLFFFCSRGRVVGKWITAARTYPIGMLTHPLKPLPAIRGGLSGHENMAATDTRKQTTLRCITFPSASLYISAAQSVDTLAKRRKHTHAPTHTHKQQFKDFQSSVGASSPHKSDPLRLIDGSVRATRRTKKKPSKMVTHKHATVPPHPPLSHGAIVCLPRLMSRPTTGWVLKVAREGCAVIKQIHRHVPYAAVHCFPASQWSTGAVLAALSVSIFMSASAWCLYALVGPFWPGSRQNKGPLK